MKFPLLLAFLSLFPLYAYESLFGQTELRYWDENEAYNGYTLFAVNLTTYLIDMEGRVVKTWPIGRNSRLLENGNLLSFDSDGEIFIHEVDWNGDTVWEYHDTDGYQIHHDLTRIFNRKLGEYTTIFIARRDVTPEECAAAGCGPIEAALLSDVLIEVDMDGVVVWKWSFMDHTVQDVDPSKPNYASDAADYPGRINLYWDGQPPSGDWLHCNSVDYNEELDQVVVNSVKGEFYVIDHGGTFMPGDPEGSIELAAGPAGDFLYRFGDPARYGRGEHPSILGDWTESTTGHKQIGGSHDVRWIEPGLPGEGNFLIFNNGQYLFERTPQSYIFEVNPLLDAGGADTGWYVDPPDAGYYVLAPEDPRNTHKRPKNISKQVVWIYNSKSNQNFFSHIGSGAQRLPNGNTLITAGTEGHIFEVNPRGELVWEYINPITISPSKDSYFVLEMLPDRLPTSNGVSKARRYGPDHPAFAGRELVPRDTITGRPPVTASDSPGAPSTILLSFFLGVLLGAFLRLR